MRGFQRFLAWVVTGPVGHFVAAVGDWWVLGRYLARQRKEKRRGGASA